jgi:hypothetical protein
MKVRPALLALALAGCARKAPPPPTGLQRVVDDLAASGSCARAIPSQWTASWPVPEVSGGRLVYRAFFFGRDGDLKTGFRFHQAEGDAEFAPDGAVLSCWRRAAPGATLPASGRKQEALDAVLNKERLLYAATEDVAALFAAAKPLTDAEKKRVAEFAAEFAGLSEPGHAEAYLALNPAFWSWVETNGGRPPVRP